jgi:hypothetical protein
MSTALSGSAFANRVFLFSGTTCQPANSNTFLEYSQFGVDNASTQPAVIECPLPLSYLVDGTHVISVSGMAYDRNTTSNVTCTLQSADAAGNITGTFSAQTNAGGPGSAAQPLPFSGVTGLASDYWRIRCTLPVPQSLALSHFVSTKIITDE